MWTSHLYSMLGTVFPPPFHSPFFVFLFLFLSLLYLHIDFFLLLYLYYIKPAHHILPTFKLHYRPPGPLPYYPSRVAFADPPFRISRPPHIYDGPARRQSLYVNSGIGLRPNGIKWIKKNTWDRPSSTMNMNELKLGTSRSVHYKRCFSIDLSCASCNHDDGSDVDGRLLSTLVFFFCQAQ